MTPLPLPFYDNPLLFGHDTSSGLLAFEAAQSTVRVHARRDGSVTTAEEAFRPFLLLADADLVSGFKGDVDLTPLDGDGVYRWIAECPSWTHALRARDQCQRVSGRAAGAPDAPYRFFTDPVHQFLLRTGKTSFRGMTFDQLRRLALDIEVTTAPGFEFPNAARESDRIIAIALTDTAGFVTVLSGVEMSEAELLAECSRLIRERDPDVIEGHNIFRFDLEYLEARARRLRVPLAWGRDGSVLRGRPSRMQIADRGIGYRRYAVVGRHIVDTWILAQLYDVAARDLPVLRSQGGGAAFRGRRARAHLPAPRGDPAHLPRGSGAAPRVCPRRRGGDARARRYPVPALFRAGAGTAIRLSGDRAAGQCDQDRCPPPARVPPPATGDPGAPGRPRRCRRLHRRCFTAAWPGTSSTWTSPRSIPPSC